MNNNAWEKHWNAFVILPKLFVRIFDNLASTDSIHFCNTSMYSTAMIVSLLLNVKKAKKKFLYVSTLANESFKPG